MLRLEILHELMRFLFERKKFVLAPLIIALFLMALLIIFAEIPALTPFIYAIF